MAMSEATKSDYGDPAAAPSGHRFWLNELPYLIVLALTLFGVGYISTFNQPLVAYWEFLAIFTGAVCVFAGWPHAHDGPARWHLIWTQALHWGAFLVAMNLVLLPSVQAIADSDTTSLTILLLLALGTFLAGVHIGSWRTSANGVVMALGVPAIAWLDQAALLLTLIVVAVAGLAAAFFWRRREMAKTGDYAAGGKEP